MRRGARYDGRVNPPDFVRPNVRAMHGYAPGEQPTSGERVVKLNTNENPYPPSPRVADAIRSVDPEALRRYPDPTATKFREAAAEVLGVTPDMILCGNGSDDVLTILTRTFVPPGGTLAAPSPTYSLYPVLAAIESARFTPVPWGDGWSLPVGALAGSGADAVYVPNPNAPSGTFVGPERFAALAEAFGGAVLIDEAYADFAGDDCLSLVEKHENVIVSRSLSKGYGLAGLRFGYCVAQPHVIAELMKVKDSYNCDALSIAAATAAIADRDYAAETRGRVIAERDRLTADLTALGFDVLPSRANFVLATVPPAGPSAADLYAGLKRRGVLVRYFDADGLRDKLRVTVGTPPQTDALLAALRDFRF